MRVPTLNEDAVPAALRELVPLAQRWGIGDDKEREAAVDSASDVDRELLVAAIDDAPDDLWSWLAGPASYDEATPE